MRNLFLVLLLCNLWFAGWQIWISPELAHPSRPMDAGPEPGPAMSSIDKAVQGSSRDPAVTCLRLGPIAEESIAESLKSRLLADGLSDVLAVSEETQVWMGHWVQVGDFAAREEADQAALRLTQGGLADAYVLPDGPPFVVSLGVYREREQADSVAAAALQLGAPPRITDRFGPGRQFWLELAAPAEQVLSLENFGRESVQVLRAEKINCSGPPDWRSESD